MTKRQMNRNFLWVALLGSAATTSIPIAVAAEGDSAVSTFFSAAEKFGVYAAVNLLLIGCLVFFLWKIVTYAIGRLEQVVDDNTLVLHRFARAMAARPCISDSDVDRIIGTDVPEEDSSDPIVKRVQARRKQRQEKGI
jgi:hypothetical protein